MTTIVISDIHNHVRWIEPALKKLKELIGYDEVVFLGDYFDDFGDSPYNAMATAQWLKASVQIPNRVHLIGNHDMPYIVPANDAMWCPGFTIPKKNVINDVMKEHWHQLRPAYYSQGYLMSHAGFNPKLVEHPINGIPDPQGLVELAEEGLKKVKNLEPHPLFLPGARMSTGFVGGITWQDWDDEFLPLPGINQIVGHTPYRVVQEVKTDDSISIDMDTNNKHIGVITNGVLTFFTREELIGE